ncbi:DNA-binding domain-containing protein [Weissella oryzae SG25]|uniref:DNA-binding domain-containing protein n=1 Tax=Weissella oryzae (strain DSM 25784 / JCM 18191 / LMG 30913 / SG25) TaxID=1329250 RepID=A0A069CTB5_WEIOS|nr:RodZ domain-containing protein [Weissella oryzae]GAK30488.1 DNA-binding domain-containing protein [Weissella oryzae SG25]
MENQNGAIGEELKAARLERNLSLDDIQQQTKIQKRYLAAIEAGNFDQLPGTFYERAFVRQYAAVVGLDPAALLEKYDLDTKEVEPDLSAARVDADNVTRTGMRLEEDTAAEKTRQLMPKVVIGVIVVVLVAAIWWAVAAYAGNSKQEASSSSVAVSSAKVESSAASSKAAEKKAASSTSKADEKKLTIDKAQVTGRTSTITVTPADKTATIPMTLKAKSAAAWTSVTYDNGVALFSGTLQVNQPEEVTIPANATNVRIQFGNAAQTDVSIDGQTLQTGSTSSVWTSTLNVVR